MWQPNDRSIGVTRTGTDLLNGLREPGNEALWQAYVERYRPLLVGALIASGVTSNDAEDLAQIALAEFAQAYRAGRYDRERGRLRAWLFGILKNQLRDWRRREAGRRAREGALEERALDDAAADDELQARWDAEWRKATLRHALEQVRGEVSPERWEAFRLFVIEARPAEEVAEQLGIPRAHVYAAKRRILERVRQLRPLMRDLF